MLFFKLFSPEMKSATQKTPKTEKYFQLVSISPKNWQKNRKTSFFLLENYIYNTRPARNASFAIPFLCPFLCPVELERAARARLATSQATPPGTKIANS